MALRDFVLVGERLQTVFARKTEAKSAAVNGREDIDARRLHHIEVVKADIEAATLSPHPAAGVALTYK